MVARPAVIALLLLAALSACARVEDGAQPRACTTTCSAQEFIDGTIERDFGFAPGSYTVLCSECEAGRGGFLRARIERNGTEIALYSRHGWCSSGGADCGWQRCISSSGETLIAQQEESVCRTLVSYQAAQSDFCPGPQSDTTADAQEQCRNGSFEMRSDGLITFSVVQASNRCSGTVAQGNPCLE